MSLIPLGFWAASGAGGVTYWVSTLGGADTDQGLAVATDSSGNSYSVGYSISVGVNGQLLLAKRDPAGAIQWQRHLGNSGSDRGYSVAVDSSDNVYVCDRVNHTVQKFGVT